MRRSPSKALAVLLALMAGAAMLQTSCGERLGPGAAAGPTISAATIPKGYENWQVIYSTGTGEVLSKRLDASAPKLLFRSADVLDTSTLLLPLPERKELLYTCLRDGHTDLMAFSGQDGDSRLLESGVGDVLTVLDGSKVAYVAPDGRDAAVWERDLDSNQRRLLYSGNEVSYESGVERTNTTFYVARSVMRDDAVDATDYDLYLLNGSDRPTKVASHPPGYGFERPHAIGSDLLLTVVEVGGERYGAVKYWSRETRETVELAEFARVLDVSDDGAVLLEEPIAEAGVVTYDDHGRSRNALLYFPSATSKPLRLPGSYLGGLDFAELASDKRCVLAYLEGDPMGEEDWRWRIEVVDLTSGKASELEHEGSLCVSEMQSVDGKSVLCVVNRLGANGLPTESRLMWMPLDGTPPVTLVTSDSGFIHMSRPFLCKD